MSFYKQLKKTFENNEWEIIDRFMIRHHHGITLWVANGWEFFTGKNADGLLDIPFYMRPFLWRHYNKMKRRQAIDRMQGNVGGLNVK